MSGPSTDWVERVDAGEGERFADYAERLAAAQAAMSRRYGPGRALHRKRVLAVTGRFEVLDDLPEPARYGLFAVPRTYDAWVRLSNASWGVQPDAVPDVRGFAVKVHGVQGEGALGLGPVDEQDFALINHPAFGIGTPEDFVGLTLAAMHGRRALLQHLVRTRGVRGALALARRDPTRRPFTGFATETFSTAAPLACGPYAARLRVLPAQSRVDPSAREDWAADVLRRLAEGPLLHEVQLQFFVDEAHTPIEDAAVDWPADVAPWSTVARLTLLRPPTGLEDDDLAARVDRAVFDPWNGLAEHRPLGQVMRARKVVYFASERARGAV